MYKLEILDDYGSVDEDMEFNTLPEVEWAIQDRVEKGLGISLVRVYKELEIKLKAEVTVK